MNRSGQSEDAEERFERLEDPHSALPPPRQRLAPQLLDYEDVAPPRARSRTSGVSPWLFVMATSLNTTVASVLAVIITLGVVNQDRPSIGLQDIVPAAARIPGIGNKPSAEAEIQPRNKPPADAEVQPGNRPPANAEVQPMSLRTIGSPERPLQVEPRRPAPFPVQIQPEGAANEPFILVLSGAPAGTTLFGADRISSDTWLLSPGSASQLQIVLPEWSTSVFEIAVALRRTNGLVAAQAKAWIAVPPPESRSPAITKMDDEPAKDLLAKAGKLIEQGDIVGARAIYQRAAEMGSGSAALALGTTYDPNRLWSLGVLGLAGNKERARQWYLRASELGSSEAKARLMALGF
jgi:hypothetical protein